MGANELQHLVENCSILDMESLDNNSKKKVNAMKNDAK